MSDRKEPGYVESEGVDTNLGRLSLGRAGDRWLVYLNDDEMCCGTSYPFARCWYGAAEFWQDRTAKQGKRGGPFGGETGGESVGLDCNWLPSTDLNDDDVWVPRDGHSIYDAAPRPPGCIDPWTEVKP